MPDIYENKYYKCVEYYKLNEKISFSIRIEDKDNKYNKKSKQNFIYLFNEKTFKYNEIIFKEDKIFDPYILNRQYMSVIKKMKDINMNETLKLKKSFIRYPYYSLKRISVKKDNIWNFINVNNNYFCFCKGFNCLKKKISQRCKYFFYLYLIDNNRNVYNKTDYLFIDFIFSELASDDAFPVFKEMYNQKLPVHYITEHIEIFNEFCANKNNCNSIIYVNKYNYTINGDFIEKNFSLLLKLKQVISGGGIYFNYINNLFYNIEYITFISITHGVCFFKYFLYENYSCYGTKRIDKLLLPPSHKLISLVKNYGWKDENIIQFNLPRWDKYNINNELSSFSENYKSIFFLFTWREVKEKKSISPYYFENINLLFQNKNIKKSLEENNIILYFSLHHKIKSYNKYRVLFKKYKHLKYIDENKISNCLLETDLVITDFSSIIFDIIYRGKPFIIYIPDAMDPNIQEIYSKKYYELINSMKNGTIEFENKYVNINKAINKIIYYINTNFSLDINLKKFYYNLQIKKEENNTYKFINYLKNLN